MRRWLGFLPLAFLPALALLAVMVGAAVAWVRFTQDPAPVKKSARADNPLRTAVKEPSPSSRASESPIESPDARLERLIATRVEGNAPGDSEAWSRPSFQLYHGLSDDERSEFRRDPAWVVGRLLRSIAASGDEARRQKILRALEIYLDEVDGPKQPRRFVARGVEMLASGALPIRLETDLAWAIARRSLSTGMETADRAAFRNRARVVLRRDLPHPDYAKVWAFSLAQLGGPEEKEIIVGVWDRLDRGGRAKLLETGLFAADIGARSRGAPGDGGSSKKSDARSPDSR
jgi:hypothetical protein